MFLSIFYLAFYSSLMQFFILFKKNLFKVFTPKLVLSYFNADLDFSNFFSQKQILVFFRPSIFPTVEFC